MGVGDSRLLPLPLLPEGPAPPGDPAGCPPEAIPQLFGFVVEATRGEPSPSDRAGKLPDVLLPSAWRALPVLRCNAVGSPRLRGLVFFAIQMGGLGDRCAPPVPFSCLSLALSCPKIVVRTLFGRARRDFFGLVKGLLIQLDVCFLLLGEEEVIMVGSLPLLVLLRRSISLGLCDFEEDPEPIDMRHSALPLEGITEVGEVENEGGGEGDSVP